MRAKSVILDIADNWGGDSLSVRAIDFWFNGSKISLSDADFDAYATTEYSSSFLAKNAFDTSRPKTGGSANNSWLSEYGRTTNERLIVVFNSVKTFDGIRINNSHSYGSYITDGAKNVQIYFSTDEITDTTYNASISNSEKIFDNQFSEHVASDIEDEQILNIDVVLRCEPFNVVLSVASGDIIGDAFTVLHPLELSLGMSGNVIHDTFIALSPLEIGVDVWASPLIPVSLQPLQIGLSMGMESVSSFETGSAIIRYFCILTGAADGLADVTLPMASFQARRRSGDPTYLSVVISTVDYADAIATRPNGTLKIQQAYEQNGVIKQTETIMETSLDEVNPDEGGTNQSTTLVGYSTSTYSAKAVTLSGVTYRSTRAGKYHYRLARPYIFLNPGDTVTFTDDGVSFVIDTMSYFINPTTSTIELAST